jgi:hypothetical protein
MLIICPDTLSYTSKTLFSSAASSFLARINIRESSAKNMWLTLGATRQTLIPTIFWSFSAYCSIADNPSAYMINR